MIIKLTLQPLTLATFVLAMLFAQAPHLPAQGSSLGSFTYQGRLLETNGPANGLFDFQFSLYSASAGPGQVGTTITSQFLPITNGLFTVKLNFPEPNNFDGSDRWLEIAIKPSGVATNYTVLTPRQQITAAPYAIKAVEAGSVLGLHANTNAGSIALGFNTTASGPGSTAAGQDTTASGFGATAMGLFSTAGGVGSVGLGYFASAGDNYSVALGSSVFANAPFSMAAGHWATANHPGSFVWGDNHDITFASTSSNQFLIRASGGVGINTNNPNGAALAVNGNVTVNGTIGTTDNQPLELKVNNQRGLRLESAAGQDNVNVTVNGTIGTTDNQPLELKVNNQRGLRLESASGQDNVNVIGGSSRNFVGAGVGGATIGGGGAGSYNGNSFTNQVEADYGTISGGAQNAIAFVSEFSTIGGGRQNAIQRAAPYATVSGGYANTILPTAFFGVTYGATIGGGVQNTIQPEASYATIGGGNLNSAIGEYATVPGGAGNAANGEFSFAAGRNAKALHPGTFVWADPTGADFPSTAANQFAIRAAGGVLLSDATPHLSFGSTTRQMINLWGTAYGIGVQSGTQYFRTGSGSTDKFAWYQGGTHSNTSLDPGTGGTLLMSLDRSFLTLRGNGNEQPYIGGDGGGGDIEIGSRNPAIMNVGFWNSAAFSHMNVFALSFTSTSDRNLKENFKAVNAREILAKVAALPLSEWNYKTDTATRHVGPMAQDFHAAFAVGPDDKHITAVDADGVALAAIQGLNEKLEVSSEKSETRIQKLETENAELKSRLEQIEKLLRSRS